jgi:glycosyltransferase involved in cell wall biosynthesis
VEVEAGAGFGYALLRSAEDAPFVFQSHGMEEFKTGRIKKAVYLPLRLATRFAARRAEKVIAPDHAMEKEVHKYLGVLPDRTIVLPLAIDLDEIDKRVPTDLQKNVLERLRITEEMTVMLSVGRIESNKGFPFLAEALARVKDKIQKPWRWVLVGKGSQESRLKKTVQELGIYDETHFAGNLSDQELAALYKRAQLFVHPTLYEGSSIVTLEAMARALPVVATTVGGIPDKVIEGENGFLVPPGDDQALAGALLRALSLGRGLARLGEEGRRRVEAEFNWTHRAKRLVDLYREIIGAAKQN